MKLLRPAALAMVLVGFAFCALGQTNNVELPKELEAILSILPPDARAIVGPWVVRIAMLNVTLSIFAPWINNKIRDGLNRIGEGSDQDVDTFLTKLFACFPYRVLAIVLRIGGINLPTTAEHNRAMGLLEEARIEGQTQHYKKDV